MKNKQKGNASRLLWNVAAILLVGVLVFSALQIAGILLRQKQAGELKASTDLLYKDAAQDVEALYQEEGNADLTPEERFAVNQQRFAKFLEINPDFVGYLSVPNTPIEYPVVQAADNEYYLDHDFAKEKQPGGTIFLDSRTPIFPMDRHLVLYGHSMNDKTMFGTLNNYTNQDYWDTSRYIYLDTLYGMEKWEIFSAYTTSTDFNYVQTSFSSDSSFQKFIETIAEKSVIDTGILPTSDDVLLTLSTCSYSFENARFVVHARLVKEHPAREE